MSAEAPGIVKTESGDIVRYEFTFQPTSTTSAKCGKCGRLALCRTGTSPAAPGLVLMFVTCGHCGQAQ